MTSKTFMVLAAFTLLLLELIILYLIRFKQHILTESKSLPKNC